MRLASKYLPIVAGVIVIAALAVLYSYYQTLVPAGPPEPDRARFGTLPALVPQATGEPERLSSAQKEALEIPAPSSGATDASRLVAPEYFPCILPLEVDESGDALRYPCPPYERPMVDYAWKGASVPEAGERVTVYAGAEVVASAGGLAFLAGSAGKLFANANINNFSARDADGFTWNVYVDSRTWGFWTDRYPVYELQGSATEGSSGSGEAPRKTTDKAQTLSVPAEAVKPYEPVPPPPVNEGQVLATVRSFFDRRGVSLDSLGTLAVEPLPPYGGDEVAVSIPYLVNGVPVVDWSGTPMRLISVRVNLYSGTVVGGDGIIDGPYDATTYPSVASGEAIQRILSGGMNPYGGWWYPYALEAVRSDTDAVSLPAPVPSRVEGTTIAPGEPYPLPTLPASVTVSWERGELAYLFMTAGRDGRTTVFLIPIYLFHGTVSPPPYEGANTAWRSWVPAIPKEYFSDVQGDGSGDVPVSSPPVRY